MFDEDSATPFWTVYDNATDRPIAHGSEEEVRVALKLTKAAFGDLMSRYRQGERDFPLLGAKRNVNIMVDGGVPKSQF